MNDVSPAWSRWRQQVDLDEYDAKWEAMAAAGESVHGEADFVARLSPGSVLDAGCGTGRVAIELARRGIDTMGVDLDADMIERARRKAPTLAWMCADLATLDLGRRFDVVVMAGNVLLFARVDDRPAIADRLAAHLAPDGSLIAGFSLSDQPDGLDPARYDALCAASGLDLAQRFATWDGDPFSGGAYAVSVHVPTAAPT